MNNDWKSFLANYNVEPDDSGSIIGFDSSPGTENRKNWIWPIHDRILSVSGNDAATFLQGQATCDIRKVDETAFTLGAFCNPKGRVLTTFRAFQRGNGYWLIIPSDRVDTIAKRLRLYVLRADVSVQAVTDRVLMGLAGADAPAALAEINLSVAGDSVQSDAETSVLHLRGEPDCYVILAPVPRAMEIWRHLSDSKSFEVGNACNWKLWEINNGIAKVSAPISEEFTPQMLNLDITGGVSFEKGCYTGQEIVARTHYLGKAKRRTYRAFCRAGQVEPGTPVYSGLLSAETLAGSVVSGAPSGPGFCLLLVLQVSDVKENNQNFHLSSGDPVNLLDLPYTLE